MKIQALTTVLEDTIKAKKETFDTNTESFLANLDREIMKDVIKPNKISQNKLSNTIQEDMGVKNFLNKLTKLGSANFLKKLNDEKIEKMLEEKRKEFEQMLGLTDQKNQPLDSETKTKAIAELEKMLSEYKKQILSEIKEREKLQKAKEIANLNNNGNMLAGILNRIL